MAQQMPVDLRDAAKTYALRKWVKDADFPRMAYFLAIDRIMEALGALQSYNEISTEAVALMLVEPLKADKRLADHVIDDVGGPVKDPEAWLKICCACAWVIVQARETAITNGEWQA